MAGVATVGMVLLMLTTSIAVLVFFLRNRDRGGLWATRIAPVLAVLGLLASLWLVLSNFTLVTGGSATLSTVLAAIRSSAWRSASWHGGRRDHWCDAAAPSTIISATCSDVIDSPSSRSTPSASRMTDSRL